jgi:transposase
MQPLLTELLNLGGIEVENYHNFGDHMVLEVEAKTSCATCPRCEQESVNVHQNHWHIAQDLRISDRDIFLKYNRRQFKCKTYKRPFSETLDFIGERRQYTNRFAEFVIKQLVHSDIHNVAKDNNITDDVVQSMLEYLSRKKVDVRPR